MIFQLVLALIQNYIISARYARKYVYFKHFLFIAIILFLMLEHNDYLKISAFNVSRALISIVCRWMTAIR